MSTAKSLLPLALFVVCVTGALGFFYFHSLEDELFLDVGGPNDEAHLRGFYAPENAGDLFYRWSSAHSFLFFPNRGHLPQVISIAADAPRPEGYGQPTISVLVNGDLLDQFVVEAGIREYSLQYVPRTVWPSDLVIQIDSPVFVPTNYPRELGVLVNTVILHSEALTTLWSRLYLALMSALPGLMLITANYLILRLSRAPVGMLICLPGLLLILIGLGVCQGTVAMGLIVSLSLISAFVLVVVAVLLRLGQRPYLASRINRWGGAAGVTLWRCYSEAFSLNSIRLRMRGITAWARTYHLDLGIALGLFVLAVLIRLPYYLEMPHITDEFREVQIAVEVARGIRYPLFFSSTDYLGVVHSYLLGFFLWLFGTSIQAPRLYMVLMGALSVVLTYWLAREMTPRWPSVIAAGLMLTSPMHVLVASHVAWVNSTTPVFCLLMLIAFYRGAVRERGFSLALSGLMAGLALQTHPTVALLFPGMIVWYVLIQHRKNRSIGHIFRRPALYAAVILFLLAYGNIIWYNAQGRLHVLAAAQRRDAIQHNPLHISVYLTSLRSMLQSLFSSLSGAVPFQFSTIIFGHLGMIFYAVWLLAGLVHVARRNQTLLLFLSLPSLALFPLVNQNWAIPDKSRYLFYLLPLFYLMMASVVVDAACYLGRIRWLGEVRRFPFARLAGVLLCLALIAYPLWPLWDFYQTFQDSEWSNRSLLRAAETLRDYRNQGIPIYVDAEIRKSHLPIVGSNLLKALEYLLFLDGTECEVISFVQHTKPPATFDHEVGYVTTDNMTSPSVWVLAYGTKGQFAEQNTVRWAEVPDLDWSDGRFGLYELVSPVPQ